MRCPRSRIESFNIFGKFAIIKDSKLPGWLKA